MAYRFITILSLVVALFLLSSGCINEVGSFGCKFLNDKDADHCYQFVAAESGDDTLCSRIKGADFSDLGSNPPRDKCYLLVANKTNDATVCNKIKGGWYSYTKEECLTNIAENTGDPKICDLISNSGGTTEKYECQKKARASPAYSPEFEFKSEEKTEELGTKPAGTTNKNEVIETSGVKPADTSKVSDKTTNILNNLPKESKDEIKTTTELKQNIVKQTPVIPQPPSTDSISEQQGYLSSAWDWITWGGSKTSEVLEENAPTGAKELGTAGTVTEAVKDVGEIKDSFNKVNEKIESGKITSSQGNLLKVGYGLGKGIKWISKNVPIVGDTVGNVADGAFQAGMKTGEKIAEHTTKTNKCIEDPLSDDCLD